MTATLTNCITCQFNHFLIRNIKFSKESRNAHTFESTWFHLLFFYRHSCIPYLCFLSLVWLCFVLLIMICEWRVSISSYKTQDSVCKSRESFLVNCHKRTRQLSGKVVNTYAKAARTAIKSMTGEGGRHVLFRMRCRYWGPNYMIKIGEWKNTWYLYFCAWFWCTAFVKNNACSKISLSGCDMFSHIRPKIKTIAIRASYHNLKCHSQNLPFLVYKWHPK